MDKHINSLEDIPQIKSYPYPIVHAWVLANNKELTPTVRHINAIACFYQCLRLIAIIYAGWYVYRLKPNSKVEKSLLELRRPTMGSWYSFIKSCMKNIFHDSSQSDEVINPLIESVKYLENIQWDSGNLTGKQKKKVSLTALYWFINHRNTYHGHFTTLTDAESSKALEVILPKLHIVLSALKCFVDYALIYKEIGSDRVFELNAQIDDDFPEVEVTKNIDELIIEGKSNEVVALMYPESELIIPLTYFITRESFEDDHDGLVKFNTAQITGEPLIFDGMNFKERQVIYLGSGSRRLREKGFDYFEDFFSSRSQIISSFEKSSSIINVLENQFYLQLEKLIGRKYQPQTYIKRDIENYLVKQIINSPDSKCLSLILGKSGSGKTSLICNIAYEISCKNNNKHQVSLQLTNHINDEIQKLEYALATNLGYKSEENSFSLNHLLNYWFEENRKMGISKPFLWIFWDALNEGGDLKKVFSWIEDYAETIAKFNQSNDANVRLIVSCREEPWNELVQETREVNPGSWPVSTLYFQEFKNHDQEIKPFFNLVQFSKKEACNGYNRYQEWAIENNERYCDYAWNSLTEEQKDFLRLPLNIWLFHNTFTHDDALKNITLSTFNLWIKNITNIVQKSHYLYLSLDLLGKNMWQMQNSIVEIDDFITNFNQVLNHELSAALENIGMNVDAFSSLPLVAQQALITSHNLSITNINPVELLEVAGLIIIDNDNLRFTYQTLSEAVATTIVWQDIVPDYSLVNMDEDKHLDKLLIELQKDSKEIENLNKKLESWQKLATWDDGKKALYNIWATRAKLALQEQNFKEAHFNLQQLQLRAQSDLVIDIISSLNKLSDPTAKLKIDSILFDMIHIQGKYEEAAELIRESLTQYQNFEDTDSYLIIKLNIRYIHHRMFYEPIQPLWLECKNLLDNIDIAKYPAQYGETLFMLGGNLGALAGNYDYQRRLIYQTIRHANKYTDDYLMSRALRKYVDYLRLKNKFTYATLFWNKAWNISEKSQTTRQGIYLLCVFADMQRQMKNHDLAILKFKQSIQLAEQRKISGWIAHNYLGLAETYIETNDLDTAETYLQKATIFYQQINQAWGKAQVAITKFRIEKLKDSSDANKYFQYALDICEKFGYEEDKKFLARENKSSDLQARCLMFL